MDVLIVNKSDVRGGAARAAYRLHRALLSRGQGSTMLVHRKEGDDHTVVAPGGGASRAVNRLGPTLDSLPLRFYKRRERVPFSPGLVSLGGGVDEINGLHPDIVHLNWICAGMLGVEDIARIRAPVVWSLHDSWVFTGGCHYMGECQRYREACGACPRLGSAQPRDLSRRVFERKQRAFSRKRDITVVGVSEWLTECSRGSALLGDRRHVCLPNPIDTGVFKPIDRDCARDLWRLPRDKRLVLFGAISATSDPRKGFAELGEALGGLDARDVELVVFGSSAPERSLELPLAAHYLGFVHDDASLVALYSAVDLMVVPSIQEAFGQTATEAMACGTPVVAFGATGLLDIVDHRVNGYLASPYDTGDLRDGMRWALDHPGYDDLCRAAREKVVSAFDHGAVAKRYVELYEKVISEAR